jgi:GxxExxY protein
MNTEPLQQEGYDFMATAFEVYNELGHGFTEDIYQEALERELAAHKIQFLPQAELAVIYKGQPLRKKLRPDLLVSEHMVVELKAASSLTSEHEAQLLNYLKATSNPVGYLVNFGCPEKLEWKRFARTKQKN